MNRDDLKQARGVLPYKSKDPVLHSPDASGQFVFVTLRTDLDEAGARAFLRTVQDATTALQQATREGRRVATVATGFSGSFFTTAPAPGTPRFPGLTGIPAGFAEPPTVANSIPVTADLACYVVSTSEGCAARFIAAVTTDPAVASVEIERGYQRLDRSEPFGYRDGVRNIEDKQNRPAVVLVDHDSLPEEPWWAHDGTYLAYLKIEQDTAAMAALAGPDQDAAIGRTRTGHRLDSDQGAPLNVKAEGEFTTATPPLDSHVRKAGPRGAVHDTVRIFRRGLPYYEVGDEGRLRQGLQFASFQASLGQFDVVFNRWMSNPSFPPGGPNLPDRLLVQKLIHVLRHGFYFVPPETDLAIGEVFFAAAPKTKAPKSGRVAVRKRLQDTAGQPHRGELGGFTFALVDAATGQQVGGTFTTDGQGHALSEDVPVGAALLLREVAFPTGFTAANSVTDVPVTLHSAREVVPIVNVIAAGTQY